MSPLASPPARPQGLVAPALAAVASLALSAVALTQASRYHAGALTAWLAAEVSAPPPGAPQAQALAALGARVEARRLAPAPAPAPASAPGYLRPLLHLDGAGGAARVTDKEWFDAYWAPREAWTAAGGAAWRRGATGEGEARLVTRATPLAPRPLPWGALLGGALAALATWVLVARRGGGARGAGLAAAALASAAAGAPALLHAAALEGQGAALAAALGGAAAPALPLAALAPLTAALPWLALGVAHLFTRGRASPHRLAYAYLAPTLLSVGLLVFVPFALGVALAFTRHQRGELVWVGLQNFVEILSGGDYALTHPLNFYFTLGVTVLWTVLNVALHTTLGLTLALLLNRGGLRLRGIYRALLIVPWAIPSYITALIWRGMFHQQYGLINHALGALGLEPVAWMGSFWGAMAANVATNTWLGFPFMMVVSLGALQSVPRDLYEAADLAGATPWQRFRHITLPLLAPALSPAVVLGSVWTFNMFNVIYLVSGGQPGGATDILITEAYRWAFEQDRYGYAAAYSLVVFVILLAYARLTQRLTRAAEEVYG